MLPKAEYTYLSEPAFDEEVLKSHKPVVVEFGAEWCGSCRVMAAIVADMAATYLDQIKVVRLDIDLNKNLVDKYGIRAKPTFLFIKDGEIVDHIACTAPREIFKAKVDKLLSMECC